MGARYRKQEELRIDLTDGDWLLVRKHLTAGEERAAQAKLFRAETARAGERPLIDLEQIGIAQAVAYLLDWSIVDASDKPIRIRDQSYEFVAAALNGMDPESQKEIILAITDHDAAMALARAQEKKVRSTAIESSPISTSVA